ncbi:MAG: M64 family metallopeptidase [Comamonadaceae bacterium]|nr:M64 family metallopeptidase [Comamonadaceae bacterium]
MHAAASAPGSRARLRGGDGDDDRVAADTPGTLRLDYFHTGGQGVEIFARRPRRPSSRCRGPATLQRTDRRRRTSACYRFEVRDAGGPPAVCARLRDRSSASGRRPTRRSAAHRTFHESLRFPEPEGPVQVVVKKRGRGRALPRGLVDAGRPGRPGDRSDASPPAGRVWAVLRERPARRQGGPAAPRRRLHRRRDARKWHADAKRLADVLFSSPLLRSERQSDFNVWAVDTPSDESGVARPSDGVHRRSARRAPPTTRSAPSATSSTFDNRRAARGGGRGALRRRSRSWSTADKYGGGGIFNLYATVAVGQRLRPLRLRPRVRPPLRRASPTSTTPRPSPTQPSDRS